MPELVKQLKPIVFSELNPPLSVILVRDENGLQELKSFLDAEKVIGLDTETTVTDDFWFRRCRTIQIGNRDKQFVIDLLAFAGSKDKLISTQGEYGINTEGVYDPIFKVLEPALCSNSHLKVGQSLSFDYTVLWWNFGKRIWHLYSTDMAERVIQAGTISLKKMGEFSMASIAARHFGLLIDKTEQEGFDLETPLTQAQINYAAFDVRFPHAMRQAQVNIMTADQLLSTAQIENDALGTFSDMSLNGQNLDDERWKARIAHTLERRAGELKVLDEGFMPIVGNKNNQIDEPEIERRFKHWKEDFELPTQAENDLAMQKRLEKDKEKKLAIGVLLDAEKKKRAAEKAVARAAHSELSKKRTEVNEKLEKCEGEAFINFDSREQLLAALQQMPGMKSLKDVTDDSLLRFNDRPLIQTLRKFRKGKKDTGTYGLQWVQRWVTKPLAKEGWRHPMDGRLHCLFNQLEAETGRTSSSKPNAQNLPQDKEVRECFIADPPDNFSPEGYDLITIDLSGAELRIIAEMAQAKSWIQAFAKGQDIHSVSTEILYPEKWPALKEEGCAYYSLNEQGEPKRKKCKCKGHSELRGQTKAVNFLLAYGGGPAALADAIGVTVEVAKELMKLHEERFPDIWSHLESSGKLAKSNREARDMYGRRRSFPVPTREMARQWWIDEREESLELSEAEKEASIFRFKSTNLREPNKEELHSLTHRNPTDKEVERAIWALNSSVERRGKNHPVQGTNASLVKRAIGCGADKDGKFYLWHLLPKYGAKLLSMIHDELIIQSPKRHSKEVAEIASDCFIRAGEEIMHSVRMESEYHIGPCWEK